VEFSAGWLDPPVSVALRRLERARGELRLEFKRRASQSVLASLYQDGCLKARMPRLRGNVPEAICINTSGGVTDGDTLHTAVTCHPDASAVVSGQAAERVYRSRGDAAIISATLTLHECSRLAWLPQETILFDGGRLARSIDVHMCESASLFAVESTILGRTAMGESVTTGSFSERWQINVGGQLEYVDAFDLIDADLAKQATRAAVLGGRIAFATAIYIGRDAAEVLNCIRALDQPPGCERGASRLGNVVVTRIAGTSGALLRADIHAIVAAITERIEDMSVPKVWLL
jgi:urease accessory protein